MVAVFHYHWSIRLSVDDLDVFVHSTAIVDHGASLGRGTKVWHWSHISNGAQIGCNCSFGQNVYVGGRAVIGNNVRVQNNVSIYDNVLLEDDVFCGPSMVFTNVINPRAHVSRKHAYLPTVLKRGVTVGANATIVCGNTIHEYAFVGAGSVIVKDVPAHAIVVGNPARRIGWMCRCGETLINEDGRATCAQCASKYLLTKDSCALVTS